MRSALSAVWPVNATLAEGPIWRPQDERLMFVDILAPSLNLLEPASGRVERYPMPTMIGSAATTADGGAIVALASGIFRFHPGKALQPLPSPNMRGIHFNDGKCDAAGRFWVGTRASDGGNGGGALFRVDPNGTVTRIADGFDVPNGLGWSPCGQIFYLIDTVPHCLYAYDFDLDRGQLGARRIIRRFDGRRGKPDGMAVDSDGRLWCAMWDGAGIEILSPDGLSVGWIDTPCQRPTSVTFGGPGLGQVFVTSASVGLEHTAGKFGAAGSILAFDTNATGLRSHGFGNPCREGSHVQ